MLTTRLSCVSTPNGSTSHSSPVLRQAGVEGHPNHRREEALSLTWNLNAVSSHSGCTPNNDWVPSSG